MSDIFVSYARKDWPEARKLANALERKGWSVWWDPKLRVGEHFDDAIEQALMESRCVIVLWSERSVQSRYVKDEAAYALRRDKLFPVVIDEVALPFRYEGIHTPRFIDWDGSDAFPAFQKLVADIKAVLGPSPAEGEAKRQAELKRKQEEDRRLREAKEETERRAEAKRKAEEQRQTELKRQEEQRRAEEEAQQEAERKAAEFKRQEELKRKAKQEEKGCQAEEEAATKVEEDQQQPTIRHQRINWFLTVVPLIGVTVVIILVVFLILPDKDQPDGPSAEGEEKVVAEEELKQEEEWRDPVTEMEFAWVPEGCFEMGSAEGGSDEKPVHEVCVDGYWMGIGWASTR